MIDIQLEQQTIPVGDALSGILIWQPESDKIPKKATVSIGWYTEGRGTRDRQTVNELALDPHRLTASQGDEIPFSLTVPYESPITYNGDLIRIIWVLKVLIDMPGFLARNDKQKWSFQVIPRQAR